MKTRHQNIKTRDINESENCLVPNARDSSDQVQIKLLSSTIMTEPLIQYKQQHLLKEDCKCYANHMTHDIEGVTQMCTLVRKQNYTIRENKNDSMP